jgi:uncharacterized membrane protein
MRLAQHTVSIARSPEEVFDFFADFSQASRWRQYVRTMERLDDGPLRAGSRVQVTMDVGGGAYVWEMEVLNCERPSLWRHRSNDPDWRGYVEYLFEPESAGTRVTMTIEAKPTGLYAWLAMPLVLLRRSKSYLEQLPHLKRALEEQ